MHIGIAGTGKMGSAIARRLLGLKHQVTVWNRTPARAQPVLDLGAAWAHSPAQLAGRWDMVITMLTDEQALDDVYCAPGGLLSGLAGDQLFIDMSTVKPAWQQEIGERVAAAGATYLECPVGGSVGPAPRARRRSWCSTAASKAPRCACRARVSPRCRRSPTR